MMPPQSQPRSRDSRIFGLKTARSIAEIQQSVNNIADVVVFLEVLGYDNNTAKKNGFENLYELAKYVYQFMDAFDDSDMNKEETKKSFSAPVPTKKQRLAESFSMVFPWLGSLILLFITGVSLWMAWGLPASITTAFLAGVFLGLIVTEGSLQTFNRLFSFYYSQTNIGEVKRSIKRSYVLIGTILAGVSAIVYGASLAANIPAELAAITIFSAVTISLHRTSYVILYALKKTSHLVASYLIAFTTIFAVYFMGSPILPDISTRYFVSLGAAFAVLSAFAIYHHHKIIGKSSTAIVVGQAPHFYSPISINDNTIASRFGVQLWECLPYFLFGTFYFAMLFGDRIISWIFNPHIAVAANGVALPLSFNSVYHIGADLALLVILPTAIVQYILISPIYALAYNRAITLKVPEMKQVDRFLRHSYRQLLIASIATSGASAVILNIMGPLIIAHLGGAQVSLHILWYASIANIMMSVFVANSIFMIFLGRVKTLAIVSIVSAIIVVAGGVFLARSGFENIVFAYLASTVVAATSSTIYMSKILRNAGSRLFSRYI